MAPEVEIGAVVDAFDFLPAERKLVLDVVGGLGVMRQLIRAMLVPCLLYTSDAADE